MELTEITNFKIPPEGPKKGLPPKPIIKKECHNCGYYNPEARGRYKCYTHECPAYKEKVISTTNCRYCGKSITFESHHVFMNKSVSCTTCYKELQQYENLIRKFGHLHK